MSYLLEINYKRKLLRRKRLEIIRRTKMNESNVRKGQKHSTDIAIHVVRMRYIIHCLWSRLIRFYFFN